MTEDQRTKKHIAPDEDSVFSRVMNTRVAQVNRRPNGQVAAVIIFNTDVTVQDANELLSKLSDQLESTEIHEFDPQFGSPVFYIP